MKRRLGIDYDQLFNAVPGHYLVLQANVPTFTIVEVNDSYLQLVGETRDNLIDQGLFEAFPGGKDKESEQSRRRLRTSLRRCVRTGLSDNLGFVRYDLVRPDGLTERRHWRMVNHPILSDGKVVGVLQSTDDVTDQYDETQLNRERIKQLEHLIELDQGKDEFISIASHQLRTPATGVKQYLAMLADGFAGELSQSQRLILDRAYQSNERQLRIINDLLKVAQVDSGKLAIHKEPLDVSVLVRAILQDMESMFERRRQRIELKAPAGPVEIIGDPEVIRMVVENLIDNASKYSYEGTKLRVTIRQGDTDVKVSVADNGVGIPAEKRKHLFQKFNRIDNDLSAQVDGTGLGLYWAKRSIILHGGDLTYRKNRLNGSVFTVSLPQEKGCVKKITEKSLARGV